MKLHQRITQITVLPPGESIFSELATTITIEDQSDGEYVMVKNQRDGEPHSIDFVLDEWPYIREAIDRMIGEISDWEEIITDTKQ